MGKFAAFIKRQKVESVSAPRGLCPYPSDQGLYPWTLLELFTGALQLHLGASNSLTRKCINSLNQCRR